MIYTKDILNEIYRIKEEAGRFYTGKGVIIVGPVARADLMFNE